MKAWLCGIPMEGFHLFRGPDATTRIQVGSLFEVVTARGPEMTQSETVTLFNDICVMAPAGLIDRERIRWIESGPLETRAQFTNAGVTIGAKLAFNEEGQLVDFVSNDRFLSSNGKTYTSYPWSTPLSAFRERDGRMVPSEAEVTWHTPEGDFTYGKFHLEEIEYNATVLR